MLNNPNPLVRWLMLPLLAFTLSASVLITTSSRMSWAQAQPAEVTYASQHRFVIDKAGKLTPRLATLVRWSEDPNSPKAAAETQLFSSIEVGPGSLQKNAAGALLVYIRVTDMAEPMLASLRERGTDIVHISQEYRTLTAYVLPSQLPQVAALSQVLSIQEALAPLHGQINDNVLPSSTTDVPTACPGGTVVSEGDQQLRAAEARAQFAVDGTGITVGILSDSFAHASSSTPDVLSGDLPGIGNPCNRLSPAEVISESVRSNSLDEGRAMAQIVHDVAPGAKLQFASADNGLFAFADNIRALRAAGADILVDDVGYFAEPFFQDGPISVAIADVVAQGAVYFTAAGNSQLRINGQNAGSYEAAAFRPTTCPTIWATVTWESCHDFDPNATQDNDFKFTVAPNGYLVVILQWAQPWEGVSTDLDLLLLTSSGLVIDGSAMGNTFTQTPFELVAAKNVSESAQVARIVVARYDGQYGGDHQMPRFKLLIIGSEGLQTIEYAGSNGGDMIGPTVFGHSGSQHAISVGAVAYTSSTTLEDFSSLGPVTLYFAPVAGDSAAPPLDPPLTLEKPDIAATDNVATTFFFSPPDDAGVYRFRGTSAAVPHAAAVAALMLEYAKKLRIPLPASTVESLLESTARPLMDITGTPLNQLGLIDAVSAILKIPPPEPPSPNRYHYLPIIISDPTQISTPTATPIDTPTPTATPTTTATQQPSPTTPTPSTPTPIQVDGIWQGTTSQNEAISFEIRNQEIVSFTVSYQIGGCGATVSIFGGPITEITNNRFNFGFGAGSAMIFADGQFASDVAASGGLRVNGTPCGNFTGTWSASKRSSQTDLQTLRQRLLPQVEVTERKKEN